MIHRRNFIASLAALGCAPLQLIFQAEPHAVDAVHYLTRVDGLPPDGNSRNRFSIYEGKQVVITWFDDPGEWVITAIEC